MNTNGYVNEKEIDFMLEEGCCIGAVGFDKDTKLIYLKLKPDNDIIDLELGRHEAQLLADGIYDALLDSMEESD